MGEGVVDRITRGLPAAADCYMYCSVVASGESVRISWLDSSNRLFTDVIVTNSLLFYFHRTNLISLTILVF